MELRSLSAKLLGGVSLILMLISAPLLVTAEGRPEVRVLDFDQLQPILQKNDDTVRVLNFWATWCIPCVRELPEFERAAREFQGKPVQFIFVSLDFPDHLESRLIPFIEKRNTPGLHLLLDDPDGNTWIPKVAEKWSGAIPATVIYRGEQTYFHEGMMSYELLTQEILNVMI